MLPDVSSASSLLTVSLVFLVVLAGITDLRRQKIPNWLTGPAMLCGMVYHLHSLGWMGLVWSIEGLCVGGGLLLILYGMGAMGAGDVKLLAAVGGMVGPHEAFWVFSVTLVLGGMYALAMMCWLEGITGLYRRVGALGWSIILTQKFSTVLSSPQSQPKLRYGLVIGLGTLMVHGMGLGG